MTSEPVKKKVTFLNSFHYFRGVAILWVVASHAKLLCKWEPSSNLDFFVANLLANATVFFIFIGGFLFQRIYIARGEFKFEKFLEKRIQFVLLPYTIWTIFFVFFNQLFVGREWVRDLPSGEYSFVGALWRIVSDLFRHLVNGSAATGYWFIPMVVLIYAISPILVKLSKSRYLGWFCLCALCVSLVVHRPPADIQSFASTFQSFVYFTPIYMLGIWCSRYYDRIEAWLGNISFEIVALAIALLLAVLQFQLGGENVGNFNKPIFEFSGIDINLIQKLCLTYFFLSVLSRLESVEIPLLKHIATISFPIYFLHMLAVAFVGTTFVFGKYMNLFRALGALDSLWGIFLSTAIMLVPCIVIANGLKWALDKKSRYVIGW